MPPDGAAGRRTGPDPLGKRSLFWATPAPPTHGAVGKRALYSGGHGTAGDRPTAAGAEANPVLERGPLRVACSVCGAVSRVGLLDFVLYQLPLGYWWPRGTYDRRMTCPACRRRVWASVSLRRD